MISLQVPDEIRYRNSSDWPRPTNYPLPLAWAVRLGRERRWLRRSTTENTCTTGFWCNGYTWIGDARSTLAKAWYEGDSTGEWPHEDPCWPRTCDTCGRAFVETDTWCYNRDRLYSVKSPVYGHVLVNSRNFPPGTVYNARWFGNAIWATGPDGLALHAVCPNGRHWHIDGQASNCTMPQEKGKRFVRTHYCWVRHGDPRHPATLHVDKAGVTCQAGAGSIVAGDYHGFLHNGGFTAG